MPHQLSSLDIMRPCSSYPHPTPQHSAESEASIQPTCTVSEEASEANDQNPDPPRPRPVALLAFFPAHAVAGYTPRQGDTFSYYEVTDLGSGTGGYTGYTEQAVVNGIERENSVYPNGTVAANYTYSWNWSNSTGSTQTQKPSGNFTWSSTTFRYV